MSGTDLVSVIMPAYNAEKYIAESIKSVLLQTYSNFELIIINDGSTDRTEDVVKTFSDHRIKYFNEKNKGVSAARNVGLLNMEGNYFCFLDADDILPTESVKSRLDIFFLTDNIEFVDGQVEIFNKDLSKKIKSWNPVFLGNPLKDLLSLTGFCFLGNTWMIKRKPGVSYRFCEGLTHSEDLLFYIQLARGGGEYAYTNESVLHYRTGNQTAMQNLIGLELGYRMVFKELHNMDDVPASFKRTYLRKAKSIIWKSYLGNYQPVNALHSLIKKW